MAVRTPLYVNSDGDLQEMSSSMMTEIKQRAAYLWGGNPSVTLAYVASGGNLRRMIDRTDVPGSARRSAGHNPVYNNPNEVGVQGPPGGDWLTPTDGADDNDIDSVTANTTYDRINRVAATVSSPSQTYPLYVDGTDIQEMTQQDMIDTFMKDAVDLIIDGNDRGGTFTIYTGTSLSNHTAVSSTEIFRDTKYSKPSDLINSSGNTIYSTSHRTTVQNYYLLKQNQGIEAGGVPTISQLPFFISGTSLQDYTSAAFDTVLVDLLRYVTVNTTDYRVFYEVEAFNDGSSVDVFSISDKASGVTPQLKGELMYNKTRTGQSIAYEQHGADAYDAAYYPSGGLQKETRYELKIYRK